MMIYLIGDDLQLRCAVVSCHGYRLIWIRIFHRTLFLFGDCVSREFLLMQRVYLGFSRASNTSVIRYTINSFIC
jgi:hypothetical protein